MKQTCNFVLFLPSEFPLRFTTEGNPSVGTMEIYTNSSWQKLCISNWNKAEEDLMCMAMGYSNSSYYGRWYEDSDNESETSINYNCTTILTKCGEHFSNKLQLCKGNGQLCILDSVVRSASVFYVPF